VTSIPGPSATLAALTSAGLPTDTFLFAGFLPPKSGARQTRLAALKDVPATLILFETAPRLAKALADMAEILGPREAVIARELTKLHETVLRGTLDALAEELAAQTVKGEVVVVVAPPRAEENEIDDARILSDLKAALETQSFRDAVRGVTEAHGLKRARVYELGLSLTRRPVRPQHPAGHRPFAVRTGARAQPRGRLHLPELQPDWRPHRLRERRAAPHLPRHALVGAQNARH
jgi:16S rRNA (cytidine1402-2'-O)-methyltransferase